LNCYVKPQMAIPQTTGTGSENLISAVTPSEQSSLGKGDTAYFTWVYEISGAAGDSVTFTASLENGDPGNTASTTVLVNDVILSQQSGTSLIAAQGVGNIDNDVLIFHAENDRTPGGAYQMFSGDADIGGLTISAETDDPNFFTNDGIAVNIPAGTWNASLTYFSAPYPDSLMDNNGENMKFHF